MIFNRDNEIDYYATGNIEEFGVSKFVVDETKSDQAIYLNNMDKIYKPRVLLDDGEAIFLMWWYEEFDNCQILLLDHGIPNAADIDCFWICKSH